VVANSPNSLFKTGEKLLRCHCINVLLNELRARLFVSKEDAQGSTRR